MLLTSERASGTVSRFSWPRKLNTPSRELGLLEIITIIFANIASRTEENGDCHLLDLF